MPPSARFRDYTVMHTNYSNANAIVQVQMLGSSNWEGRWLDAIAWLLIVQLCLLRESFIHTEMVDSLMIFLFALLNMAPRKCLSHVCGIKEASAEYNVHLTLFALVWLENTIKVQVSNGTKRCEESAGSSRSIFCLVAKKMRWDSWSGRLFTFAAQLQPHRNRFCLVQGFGLKTGQSTIRSSFCHLFARRSGDLIIIGVLILKP